MIAPREGAHQFQVYRLPSFTPDAASPSIVGVSTSSVTLLYPKSANPCTHASHNATGAAMGGVISTARRSEAGDLMQQWHAAAAAAGCRHRHPIKMREDADKCNRTRSSASIKSTLGAGVLLPPTAAGAMTAMATTAATAAAAAVIVASSRRLAARARARRRRRGARAPPRTPA
jgi:hypothetical protein